MSKARIRASARKSGLGPACLAALVAVSLTGCDLGNLLDVTDPDLVVPNAVEGEQEAELSWAGAVGQFAFAYSSGDGGQASPGGQVIYVGLFTDEFHLSGTFPTREEVDQRSILPGNGTMDDQYEALQQARTAAERAVPVLEEFFPGDPRIAEMHNLAGYTYVLFGENYCSGVPYSGLDESGEPVYGPPTPTAESFTLALDRFTSASSAAADNADQQYLAAVGRGRALLNQGLYAEAAAAVATVPTDWQYIVRSKEGSTDGQRNAVFEFNQSQRRWSLSDQEGVNGIAFRSAPDARVPWEDNENIGFDEDTPLFEQLKYPSFEADVPLASGIEARLIEAEAALAAGDPAGMLTILNALRATVELDAIADPGNDAQRLDLLFEERGRWLFATSHRLGDLRRLVRQYDRAEDNVFPSGPFFKGGSYGDDVNFRIPDQEKENPEFTGCLDRSA